MPRLRYPLGAGETGATVARPMTCVNNYGRCESMRRQSALRHLSTRVELVKCENHINDAEFATRLTDYLQTLL